MDWERTAYGRRRAGGCTIQQINDYSFRVFKDGSGEIGEGAATLCEAKSMAEAAQDKET